jgi:hypothetical protein
MPTAQTAALPSDALLQGYVKTGAYTDCYSVKLDQSVSLAEFMAAFYTTPIFKLERWLLARALGLPSKDQDAQALASGEVSNFSAWQVEARNHNQIVLAFGRTRSWLMVHPQSPSVDNTTVLFFGSAVVPRTRAGLGWQFTAFHGFHKLYSQILLGSAANKLSRGGA